MATNQIKTTRNTPIVWSDTTDYASTVSGYVRTNQIDLTSLASLNARQGAKADLGATREGQKYAVYVGFEFASLAASNENVDVYWASSPHATAGNANPGGTSGADAAYTGTAGDSLTDSLPQLIPIGSFVTTSDNTTTVQYGRIGVLDAAEIERYGMPVVVNNSAGAFVADAVEMFIALVPLVADIQAAA